MPAIKSSGIKEKCIFFSILFCFLIPHESLCAKNKLTIAGNSITSMRKSLDHVAKLIRKAVDKSEVSLVNCLRQKEALMKTYFNRALRNQDNLRAAFKSNDTKQSARFLILVQASQKKVKEIEKSLKDCKKGEIVEEKTKVNVIKPEGDLEETTIDELFPEGESGEPEGLPIVPPASPYQ